MSEVLLKSISPEQMAAVLQKAGYRAHLETVGERPQLRSAAQGLGFFVAFGGVEAGQSARFVDLAFNCAIAIEGELPDAVLQDWNRTRRYARLFRAERMMVLSLDVLLLGGVSEAQLLAQCELWDRLLQDLIRYLREPGAAHPTAQAA